ncbi:hypothetical protein SDC9_207824 [bioreactor metagenome]|uniref:Uncharacterized protein n=1 Tax=bioreactor metagenome TaxID=1076179 RepID=A0A645JBG0_9ZZZZ
MLFYCCQRENKGTQTITHSGVAPDCLQTVGAAAAGNAADARVAYPARFVDFVSIHVFVAIQPVARSHRGALVKRCREPIQYQLTRFRPLYLD